MIIHSLKRINLELFMQPLMPIASWYLRVSPRMVTCREFNDFIFDYTEGLLTEKQAALFERHMKICPMCRNFMKTYTATFKAGKAFFPYSNLEVPNTVPADLLNAITDVTDS